MLFLGLWVVAGYSCLAIASWSFGAVTITPPLHQGDRAVVLGPLFVVTTLPCIVALVYLRRHADVVTEQTLRWVARVTLANAAVNVFAFPIVDDFWFYLAEGRHFLSGANGYYVPVPPATLAAFGLKPSRFALMMYGPFWAYLSAGLVWIGHQRVWLEYAVVKLAVTLAWWLIVLGGTRLMKDRAMEERVSALVLLGWFPASVYLTVAEGHNDAVMVAGVVWWLVLRQRYSSWAPLPLAASVFVKYSSAPLLVIAVIDLGIRRRWREMTVLAGGLVFAGLIAAPLWAGSAFFGGLQRQVSYPPLFSAVAAIGGVASGLRQAEWVPTLAVRLFRLLLACVVSWTAVRYMRDPRFDALLSLVVCTLAALLLAWANVLPWYCLWIVPLLTATRTEWHWRALMPAVVLLPIMQACWFTDALWNEQRKAAVLVYAVAGIWTVLAFVRRTQAVPAMATEQS